MNKLVFVCNSCCHKMNGSRNCCTSMPRRSVQCTHRHTSIIIRHHCREFPARTREQLNSQTTTQFQNFYVNLRHCMCYRTCFCFLFPFGRGPCSKKNGSFPFFFFVCFSSSSPHTIHLHLLPLHSTQLAQRNELNTSVQAGVPLAGCAGCSLHRQCVCGHGLRRGVEQVPAVLRSTTQRCSPPR